MFYQEKRKKITKSLATRCLQFFLQGLIVLAPIGITIYVVVRLFNAVDNILPNILHQLMPSLVNTSSSDGNLERFPGLGFAIVIVLVMLVGWVSSSFVVGRLVAVLDTVLESTPGIKFIYSSVKDFLEAFAGNKKKFEQPVLVNVDASNVWRIGFITNADVALFELNEHVAVYVPHSYAISGITYLVPTDKIKKLTNVSAADAMKFTVSGGVSELSEQ
jgi:uncharacterized membrane protein